LIANQREDLRLKEEAMLKKSGMMAIESKISFNFGKLTHKNAEEIKKSPEAADCFLLKQQHGTTGFVVNQETRNREKLSQLGDFLLTNIPKVKLGILTADCLPIIFNDTKNKAVGIAHAGWRGSLAGISKEVINSMIRNYNTKEDDISIVFGPCIHACCYKVKEDLIARVKEYNFGEKTIIKRGDDQFFDLLAFNKALLISLGVKEAAIDSSNSKCTSCNTHYHSHRREGEQAGRQLSTVWIE
jgi:YfiH family protein